MIEPHVSVSNYELELTQEHLKKLDAKNIEELRVFVLVRMAKEIKDVTINLQGPLVFNPEKRLGLQFIIPDGIYSTRHLLFGDKLKDNKQEEPSSEVPEEQQ